jgi:hypothetical protein
MSKSSRIAWVDCIASLCSQDMPACPQDLNEPHYLALLRYDQICTVSSALLEHNFSPDNFDGSFAHKK